LTKQIIKLPLAF